MKCQVSTQVQMRSPGAFALFYNMCTTVGTNG